MQSNFCWVIQLFSLVCTVKGYYDREWAKDVGEGWAQGEPLLLVPTPSHAGLCSTAKEMMTRDRDCLLPVEEAGIIWDSICFFFLLLQRRIFLSHYFLHVSADLKATALQASRSAQLLLPGWKRPHPPSSAGVSSSIASPLDPVTLRETKEPPAPWYHQGGPLLPTAGHTRRQCGPQVA